ncbi:hydroxymethylglutaryl-coenzyme A synthase C terminal-domain-containing protein [Hyaloraphidium curvatum]|nr:hydroxymethylglutaryl-coenzyme A synthase C terminal-domain-containing protein [Hyaloraphidium curvatum]
MLAKAKFDAASRAGKARDVGICAMEVYFPRQCVDQEDLERFDGASTGKYTIGLGQTKMAFCDDREDINSICLTGGFPAGPSSRINSDDTAYLVVPTVVESLMAKYKIPYTAIGRLEVGTETIIDKSKSTKSVLMQLFQTHGNTAIEGVDTHNACYGGTNALFNAINWVESSSWDGRFALVVAGDIAVYAHGNARPTGGAGAVAMLVGPDAVLVADAGIRGTHMEHAWDFFKPDLSSEFPEVDGKLSVSCYLGALDACYARYLEKFEALAGGHLKMDDFDYFCFHSPYTKLVQKSFARLALGDFVRDPSNPMYAALLEKFKDVKPEDTYFDREVEKTFMDFSKATFNKKVAPSLLAAKQLGNMYCGSLYGGLASLVSELEPESLLGKRIVLFSYGSGLASTMFSFTVARPTDALRAAVDIRARLDSRLVVPAEEFDAAMRLREETHQLKGYVPKSDPARMFPGAYYLESVDDKFRRSYGRAGGKAAPVAVNGAANGAH